MTHQLALKRPPLTTVLALLAGLWGSSALALPTINLTNETYVGSDGPVNVATTNNVTKSIGSDISNSMGTVYFGRDSTQPAGTGVFNPFLRLDCKGNGCDEQGYNTSGVRTEDQNGVTTRKVLDNMTPVNWTHDVRIADLQLDATGGYYVFKLDINEPGNANSLLSLDGVRLYSTNLQAQTNESLEGATKDWKAPAGNNLLWDMDLGKKANGDANDNSVLLDARVAGGPGSGVADMVMFVERDIIDARAQQGDEYLILWSRFGLEQGADSDDTYADAGFEEWAFMARSGTPNNGGGGGGTVPTPGTLALAGLGLIALRFGRRRSLHG